METVTKTYRLPVDIAAWLEEGQKSSNQTLIDKLRNYKSVISVSTNELKGVFEPSEWSLLVDILNGTIIPSSIRCNNSVLVAQIEDACELDGVDDKWHVVKDVLISKISRLTGAQIEALYTRIESFWDDSYNEMLSDFAKF